MIIPEINNKKSLIQTAINPERNTSKSPKTNLPWILLEEIGNVKKYKNKIPKFIHVKILFNEKIIKYSIKNS
jgi:hypothetical protein